MLLSRPSQIPTRRGGKMIAFAPSASDLQLVCSDSNFITLRPTTNQFLLCAAKLSTWGSLVIAASEQPPLIPEWVLDLFIIIAK